MTKTLKSVVKYLSVAAIWLVIWYLCAELIGEELLFPNPLSVAKRIAELCETAELYKTVRQSLLRILIGMAAGTLIGTAGGIITAFSKVAKAFFAPALAIVKSTPVTSFILLLVLWVSRDKTPLIIAAMMVIPVVWNNVEAGIQNTDRALLEMATAYGLKLPQKILKIYLPGILPYFFASLRSSMGMAWKAGIAAEVLLQPTVSIGKMIFGAKLTLETVDLFAWTAIVVVLSVVIEKITVSLLHLILKKYSSERKGGALID